MNHTLTISLGIVCALAVALAGCTGTGPGGETTPAPTPTGTAIPVGDLVITEEQNGAMVSLYPGSTITLEFSENPTTGYQWDLTVTPGLEVTRDTYEPSDPTGTLVGSGGTRIWEIKAIGTGQQEISAVYRRSWEPVTGDETLFAMLVDVGEE